MESIDYSPQKKGKKKRKKREKKEVHKKHSVYVSPFLKEVLVAENVEW